MSGMASVGRRTTAGAGRSRRNMYSADFESEAADQTSGIPLTGGIFKNAAFEVLKQEERLMTSGEITKLAMERRLLRCTGKTPENTMASALYTEVRKKANTTVFIKPKEGLFGLKAWLSEPWLLNWLAQEGIDVADLQEPSAPEPVSKKVRTSYNGAAPRLGGGSFNSNRNSTSGAQLMRSSSAGICVREPVGGGVVAAAHRSSLNGQTLAPGGGGGGAVGRGSSFTSLGNVAPLTNAGMQRLSYVGGGRGNAENGIVTAGTVAATGSNYGGGAAADALSSLHLLVDAADEIEGGPECEEAAIPRPPIVRRRSDSLIRQTSFRRQRPPLDRETSLPSMIARVRVRDEFEEEQDAATATAAAADGDEDGDEVDDEEYLDEDDDGATAAAAAVAAAASARHDALNALQRRQHSSNNLHRTSAVAAAAAAADLFLGQRKYGQLLLQQQRQLRGQQARAGAAGVMGEVSWDDDGDTLQSDPADACEPQYSDPRDGGEPKSVRWAAGAEDLGQHPGVYRGLRGGRIAGIRNALTDGGGRPVGPSALTRRGDGSNRRASEPDRLAAFAGNGTDQGDLTEDDDGQDDEGEEVLGEEGRGPEVRELAQQQRQQRRWELPPRPGSGRRGSGGRRAGQQQQQQLTGGVTQRCSLSSRHHADGAVPPPAQQHLSPRSLSAAQLPVMQMPGTHVPLHVLERMPPSAAVTSAAAAGSRYGTLPCSVGERRTHGSYRHGASNGHGFHHSAVARVVWAPAIAAASVRNEPPSAGNRRASGRRPVKLCYRRRRRSSSSSRWRRS
ncbi:hypothetical protein Vretimale_997 [Volvox reticuliferus]|uniref:HTH HARE-type domain-containing protein n=1 Tax=Volvox reticuliferus TaxID=1737510 RepID=A0A8J4G1I5_9CHLO|nr:hypothetical protein Vretimale_997 [Volvox reticuliferus]